MKNYFRHGDVILRPLDKKEKIQGEEQKKLVLAEDEVTGHSHQITDGAAKLFKWNEKMYLKVTSERAALTHEEHKRIDIPCGDYEVIIQKEYVPNGWKKVQD